jgi:hypothetical protein
MPYTIRKRKCKQTDGDAGSYVLSYTDKKGKKHSNCNTSRKKAQGQISAIEMDESIEENWVPLAARITDILEEELSILAGAFKLHEGGDALGKGDRVRPSRLSSEIMVHTKGKVPQGTIVRDNGDGTFDVEWDPLPKSPAWRGDDEDDVQDDPEDTIEYRVPVRRIKRAKPV